VRLLLTDVSLPLSLPLSLSLPLYLVVSIFFHPLLLTITPPPPLFTSISALEEEETEEPEEPEEREEDVLLDLKSYSHTLGGGAHMTPHA